MQTVLVAGGSRGIGAATVRMLRARGKCVCFLYERSEAAAQKVAAETGAYAIKCDIADPESVKAACCEAARIMGRIEGLVCCAGIALKGLFTDIKPESWRRLCDVDLSGSMYLAQAVLPQMISRRSGAIVFVSSVWGSVGASCEAHYSAAKAALHGLTKALSKEAGPSGVRVNCVAPGVIDTDMNKDLDAESLSALAEETPLGRIGSGEDVANAICFLLGEEAGFITGQVLGVDGGFGL